MSSVRIHGIYRSDSTITNRHLPSPTALATPAASPFKPYSYDCRYQFTISSPPASAFGFGLYSARKTIPRFCH